MLPCVLTKVKHHRGWRRSLANCIRQNSTSYLCHEHEAIACLTDSHSLGHATDASTQWQRTNSAASRTLQAANWCNHKNDSHNINKLDGFEHRKLASFALHPSTFAPKDALTLPSRPPRQSWAPHYPDRQDTSPKQHSILSRDS